MEKIRLAWASLYPLSSSLFLIWNSNRSPTAAFFPFFFFSLSLSQTTFILPIFKDIVRFYKHRTGNQHPVMCYLLLPKKNKFSHSLIVMSVLLRDLKPEMYGLRNIILVFHIQTPWNLLGLWDENLLLQEREDTRENTAF